MTSPHMVLGSLGDHSPMFDGYNKDSDDHTNSGDVDNYFDAGDRREELVGIAFNRLMKMSLPGGDHLTTWRYNTVKVFFKIIKKAIIHISSSPKIILK